VKTRTCQLAEIEGRAAAEAGSAHNAHTLQGWEAVAFVHGWLVAKVEAEVGEKILPEGAPEFPE
jgi:hypothetical protein